VFYVTNTEYDPSNQTAEEVTESNG